VRAHVLTGHHGIVGREQASHSAEAEAGVRLVIDALGRKCPIPIIMLAEQIGSVLIGEVIAVLADDPAAFSDVPAWAAMKSHDLAFRVEHQTGWAFGIRRNY
jgi:tRNA 2-thiouridine synthesizing protein A